MRIIDNKKDYYDYLAGVWGIDGYITYDRRNSTRLVNKTSTNIFERYPMGYGHIFCTWKNGVNPDEFGSGASYEWDNGNRNADWIYRHSGHGWSPKKNENFPDAFNVSSDFFTIVIGSVAYEFIVYRILQNQLDKEVKIVPKLMHKFKINRSLTKSQAPILLGGVAVPNDRYYGWKKDDAYYRNLSNNGRVIPDRDGKFKENPILEGTWIPSMIPAEEVWNNITDYLLSIKEPKIVDNRTDVQHLESHGFDKKTSFRNVK